MKQRCLGINHGSSLQTTTGAPPTTDLHKIPASVHDSVIVSTLVVKEPGERLLTKATLWLAEPDRRYTTSRGIARIFYHFLLIQKEHAGRLFYFV